MKHLKTIFFLLVCLAAGVGIGKAYIWLSGPAKRGFEHSDGPPVITGIGNARPGAGLPCRYGTVCRRPPRSRNGKRRLPPRWAWNATRA